MDIKKPAKQTPNKPPKNEVKINEVEGISLTDAVQIKRPKRKVITGKPKK